MSVTPASITVDSARMQVVEALLKGHLTRVQLANELARASAQIASNDCAMVLDCFAMDDYDLDARHAFVDWQRENKGRLRGVAILTTRSVWHVVISAMSLASGQKMRPFDNRASAVAWLESLG